MIVANDIERVAVYPPLGIARVGNAPGDTAWFFGSEIRGKTPDLPDAGSGPGRDEEGKILRQAVRFRAYAHLKDGSVVELTQSNGATLEWQVTLANLKAGWYDFNQAMDLPGGFSKDSSRRNSGTPTGRSKLDITPGSRMIRGVNQQGGAYQFDNGSFFGVPVYLGELRTDDEGRLIVLGGKGQSAPRKAGTRPTTFANNQDWHDDVSDGPVRVRVTVEGRQFLGEAGYVAVAPPNYAPGLFGVVTMEDAALETWFEAGWLPRPQTSSFVRDIWPIFHRLSQMSWVNHGLFVALGQGSPLNATDPQVIERLRDKSAANLVFRTRVATLFLAPSATGFDPGRLPQVFGDGYGETNETAAIERLAVTRTMHEHLNRWKDGQFDDDWQGSPPVLPNFEDLSAADQVHHLERVALYECLGGPFHPGIELTWPLRDHRQWKRPYRLAVLDGEGPAAQDFGPELSPEACLANGGPLDGVAAGSMTRWLGVPWQTDEASCNSEAEYAPSLYLSMPSFWGARVPDQVLSSEAWSRVKDASSPLAQRRKHFSFREDWLRDIRGRDYFDRIHAMVTRWWELGIVAPHPVGPGDTPDEAGGSVWVETGRPRRTSGSNHKVDLVAKIERLDSPLLGAGVMAAAGNLGAPKLDAGAGMDSKPYEPPLVRFKRGEV